MKELIRSGGQLGQAASLVFDTQRSGSLQVDDQLKSCRLFDGQIGGVRPIQNLSDEIAGAFCARTARGTMTAAPPTSLMNSRRYIASQGDVICRNPT
jgi:hypothetical protein